MTSPVSEKPRRQRLINRLGLPQTPPPWGLPEVITTLAVVVLAMLIVASGVAVASSPVTELVTPVSLAVGWGIGALMVTGYVLLTRRRTPQDWVALRLERGLIALPLVLLMGVAIGATVDSLAGLANGQFGRTAELRNLNLADSGQLLVGVVLVGVLLPLAHGLAFTGVMLPALRVRLGPWLGILTTTLLYSLYHFLTFGSLLTGGDRLWYGGFVPFFTMLCLCVVRIAAASTRAAVIAAVGAGVIGIVLALLLQ